MADYVIENNIPLAEVPPIDVKAADDYWTGYLARFGVRFDTLNLVIRIWLENYSQLHNLALAAYKHHTRGEFDRLSHCSGPIIENIKKHQASLTPTA